MNKLGMLNGWKGTSEFVTKSSAQSYFGINQVMACSGSRGSSCGSGDDGKPAPKPTACGSACGTGDK